MKRDHRTGVKHLLILIYLIMLVDANLSAQPSAREIRGAAPVVPLTSEPPPKLFVDPPLAGPLSLGRVVIQYRADNVHIVPVYGPAALNVSPRVGHVHVTVDSASWHWADASGEPLILNGFTPGPHRIMIEMTDPTHKVIESKTINFVIPEQRRTSSTRK